MVSKRVKYVMTPEDVDEEMRSMMPHSAESEQVVVTQCMMDTSAVGQLELLGLEPHHVYVPRHRAAIEAIYSVYDSGQLVNSVTVTEALRAKGTLQTVGGMTGINDIMYGVPHVPNVAPYVEKIIQRASLRDLIKVCNMIQAHAFEDVDKPEEILTQAESSILEVVSEALRGNKRGRERTFVKLSDDKSAFRAHIENLHNGKSTALPTGVKPLDDMLEGGGLQPQGFYMIAAEPKAGKTSLALSIARRIAQDYAETGARRSVGVMSMEMRRMALQMRMFSGYTGIQFSKLAQKGFAGIDYDLALHSIDRFFDTFPLYITDALFSIADMWRECEKLVLGEAQAGALVVDYIQLASLKRGASTSVEHRTNEVTAISRELKRMAQEFNVPLIGISSLNREGTLRESGQLEYDCEALIKLKNPAYKHNMSDEDKALLEKLPVWDIGLNLQYQRNGPTGTIPLKFLREYMDFLTLDEYDKHIMGPQVGSTDVPEATDPDDLWAITK